MRARENPFRSERLESLRYRLLGTTWPELLQRCAALNYRAALVGPCGSGKTTLLEQLEPRFQQLGFGTRWIRLNDQRYDLDPRSFWGMAMRLTSKDFILFDGAEQLNPLEWQWFRWRTRRCGGLIITTHTPGRLPTLWNCRTSPELLAELAADLLNGEAAELENLARKLFIRHRGNIRDALRECYDMVAQEPLANARHGEPNKALWREPAEVVSKVAVTIRKPHSGAACL